MRTDYIRQGSSAPLESRWIVVGYWDVWYNAGTVAVIDSNLEDLARRGQPDHPDINRLLDARRMIGVWSAIWGNEQAPGSSPDPVDV